MRRWRVPAAGAVVALLVVVAYFLAFHQPGRETIDGLGADTAQLRSQQAPLARDIKGLQQVAARQPELEAALQRLERYIPAELSQPALLTQIQGAADTAGVQIVSITFGDPEVPKNAPESHLPGTVLVTMPVTVVGEGGYGQITDLLRRVEVDFDRAVLVGTVALTESEAGFPLLRGTWSGQVYALLPATDPLVVGADVPPKGSAASAEQPKQAP